MQSKWNALHESYELRLNQATNNRICISSNLSQNVDITPSGTYQAVPPDTQSRTSPRARATVRSFRIQRCAQARKDLGSHAFSLPCGWLWQDVHSPFEYLLGKAANRCDVNYRTALRWRHRFLAETRELAWLGGVVEKEETFFAESANGDRHLRARRPLRKRGGRKGKRGLSHAQQPVMPVVHEASCRTRRQSRTDNDEECGDIMNQASANRNYGAARRQLERSHEVINRSQGERRRGPWHPNIVNKRHRTMKSSLNHWHQSVSTKYFDNYMNWFIRREFRPDKTIEPDFIRDHM